MPKSGTYPGSQRPAEPVATGFFGGSNRVEKCGSVKGLLGQRGCRRCADCPALSRSSGCQDRGCRVFLLSQGKQSAWLSSLAQSAGLSPVTPLFSNQITE